MELPHQGSSTSTSSPQSMALDVWLQGLDQTFSRDKLVVQLMLQGVPSVGKAKARLYLRLNPCSAVSCFPIRPNSSLVRMSWKILSQKIVYTWILTSDFAFIEPSPKHLTFSHHISKMQIHRKLRYSRKCMMLITNDAVENWGPLREGVVPGECSQVWTQHPGSIFPDVWFF